MSSAQGQGQVISNLNHVVPTSLILNHSFRTQHEPPKERESGASQHKLGLAASWEFSTVAATQGWLLCSRS